MPKLSVKRSLTSKPITVYLQKISDGRPLTGLLFNTASLVANYRREGDATVTAITLVTATVGTWTSGGFKEVDATNQPGMYELGLPNAALSSGAVVTGMLKGATDMLECPFELALDAVDVQDTVRMGLTALPAVAAGASGGLPTGNASGQVTTVTNLDKTGYTASTVSDKTGYTVSTVSDKTGYSLSAGGVQAIWDALTSALTTVGSIGKRIADNLDVVLSTRASSAALATVQADTDDMQTRLPAALVGGRMDSSIGALAAAGITAMADAIWNAVATSYNTAASMGQKLNAAGTAGDPLTAAVPGAYGAGTAGAALGRVDVAVSSRNSVVPPTTAAIQTAVAAGSVASVVGAVGSVTGNVGGNVTGSVGSVVGAVGSVTAGVTVTTNNDKTGYALSTAGVDAILDDAIGDGTITMRQALRVLIAGMAGKLSGGGTSTITIRNLADTANVVVATVDSEGSRSAVTVTP